MNYIERVKTKINQTKSNSLAISEIGRKEIAQVYAINYTLLIREIKKLVAKKEISANFLPYNRQITNKDMKSIFDSIGQPCDKYPTCLNKKDVCKAYSMSYSVFRQNIKESDLNEEIKEKIMKTRVIFPATLALIEQLLGDPNTPFNQFSISRLKKMNEK